MRALCWLSLPLLLGGCLNTIVGVVTAPVRVAGKAVDLATTSQSEADQTRGRRLREKEERLGRLARKRDRQAGRCRAGRVDACRKLEELEADIERVRRQLA